MPVYTTTSGVDLEAFATEISEDIISKYHLPLDKKLVGFIGNWEAWLAIEDVLESAKYFDDGTKVVMIGTARSFEKYKNAYPSILFTGRVPHWDAVQLLKRMDVCICPYSNESIAKNKSYRKVLEYLAAGKPIVATRIRAHTQVLNDEVAFLADPNPKDLSRALIQALQDETMVDQKVQNARNLYKDKYSREIYYKNMKFLLKSIS